MTRVKRVRMDKLEKIQPRYANADGAYNSLTDTIYVDAALPAAGVPSSGSVLQHERAHAVIHKANLGQCFPGRYEEQFCELYSLVTTPEAQLTSVEATCRRIIFRDLRWAKKQDRGPIIERILILCQIQPTRELMTKLAGDR